MKRYAIMLTLALSFLMVQTAVAAPVPLDLVTNGGFENVDTNNIPILYPWVQSGNYFIDGVANDNPHTGTWAYDAGAASSGGLGYVSQTLGTVAGKSYELTFWFAIYDGRQDGNTPSNQFQVVWDGKPIFDQPNMTSDIYPQYAPFSFKVTASQTSTTLDFGFTNDVGWSYLDDVSVKPVPVPATVLLLGSGLVGLLGWRRFRKS